MRGVFFFASLLCVDFLTKIAAIYWIPPLSYGPYPFGGIPIFSIFNVTCSFNYIVNTGAAWGIFSGFSSALFLFRILVIAALFIFVPKKWQTGLILTGAIGNVIDYLLYHHVIDFIHFTFWGKSFPVFNVADSCITIGILGLLFFSGNQKKIQGEA